MKYVSSVTAILTVLTWHCLIGEVWLSAGIIVDDMFLYVGDFDEAKSSRVPDTIGVGTATHSVVSTSYSTTTELLFTTHLQTSADFESLYPYLASHLLVSFHVTNDVTFELNSVYTASGIASSSSGGSVFDLVPHTEVGWGYGHNTTGTVTERTSGELLAGHSYEFHAQSSISQIDSLGVASDVQFGFHLIINEVTAPPHPVPEPSSCALLSIGTAALAIGAYRRRRAMELVKNND